MPLKHVSNMQTVFFAWIFASRRIFQDEPQFDKITLQITRLNQIFPNVFLSTINNCATFQDNMSDSILVFPIFNFLSKLILTKCKSLRSGEGRIQNKNVSNFGKSPKGEGSARKIKQSGNNFLAIGSSKQQISDSLQQQDSESMI